MSLLNLLTTNFYIYWGIIIILLIVDIILTAVSLKRRKRQKIKSDFLEVEAQQEKLEQQEDEPINEELVNIINKMEEDSKIKPEEVVKKFEIEQEQNAIISYQELVDSVNNNKVEIVEDDNGDIDFVEQLTKEMGIEPIVETVEEPEPEVSAHDLRNTIEMISNPNKKQDNEPTHLDIIDELDDNKRFVSSEAISPVFGVIDNNSDYIKAFNNTVEVEQVAGTDTKEEIKKNEAFLKALIKFRNNL